MQPLIISILVCLSLVVSFKQEYKAGDFVDFTRSRTEHQVVVKDKPYAVKSVHGTILFHEHPGEPLADVLFEIQGPLPGKEIRHSITNQTGQFKIPHVQAGKYRFKATRDGFNSVVGWIEVSNKNHADEEIRLEMGIGN